MGIEVREPTANGVSVNHPRVREAMRNMVKRDRMRTSNPEHLAQMLRIVGQPADVLRAHEREVLKEK